MNKLLKLLGTLKKKEIVEENISDDYSMPINQNITKNVKVLTSVLGNSSDIVIREFKLRNNDRTNVALIYTDGLVDKKLIHDYILETLMIDVGTMEEAELNTESKDLYQLIKSSILTTMELTEIKTFSDLFQNLLSGNTILMIDGYSKGFAIGSRGWADRGIQEPSSQQVVRGPKDAFTETLRTNTALIRRRIKDPNLWMEPYKIGKKSKTDITITYLHGVARQEVVDEVKKRLDKIDIDSILDSGYIEELIQDETYTPFPTIYNTERPDSVCAGLLEGRVAIIVDGTPFVLLAPTLFIDFMQSSEDYYQRSDIGTLTRLLRFLAFFLALLTPSAYIALTTFHQEMIPTTLLISLAAQREGIPFPAFVEALIMEITFEILREAGVRLPRAVGSAISIVGALVLGQAAVEAGIVSAAMVIVVSLTAISSFVFPTYNLAISVRMLRFCFMILAAILGIFGIILGLILLVMHLVSLRSFGVPYLSPMAPFSVSGQNDSLIRVPTWLLHKRPKFISGTDAVREQSTRPKPPNTKS